MNINTDTMKCIYVLSVLLVFAAVQADEKYSSENDDLDIDAVVADVDALKGFVGCFMDAVTCHAVAADFKKDLPEAVATSCSKCTDAQKHIFHRFLLGLKQKLPADYEAFKKKFDPEGLHFHTLEANVANS
ncbi:ejaculatory bulb-specific protein 3-like isoform X1 [Spodoptera litura]|uniref:Ejaculatory bulb-specific protein 3-like isoform X1 n=2 Tax=Spodoptera litura TaxID=69820 RepID=A0A9J7J2C5_SPOLT|nr:ejaculatory bulb-specific protein 3-like isoform X1 [Spodoptera litura]